MSVCLPSQISIVETMIGCKRRKKAVVMTTIGLRKTDGPAEYSNLRSRDHKPYTLPVLDMFCNEVFIQNLI